MTQEIQEILEQINSNAKMANKVNLSGKEVADVLGCSQATLNFWRKDGLGPEYVKAPGMGKGINQRVFYPKLAVAKWLAKNTIKTA